MQNVWRQDVLSRYFLLKKGWKQILKITFLCLNSTTHKIFDKIVTQLIYETQQNGSNGGAIPFHFNYRKKSSTTGSNRETSTLLLLQEVDFLYNSANEEPELLLFTNGLAFRTTRPSFLIFYKIRVPLLCLWVLPMVCHSFHVPGCNSLLFLNPFLLINKCFLFKASI